MRIFISAGEPSGDLHAANLVRSLRTRFPDATFAGFGGPHFEAAGGKLIFPLVELAVMWFGRVLLNFHKFLSLASQADRFFRHERPDVVVLIDYPGFHWWIAWRAKVRGIPLVYYVPPQIWAWGGWRVKKVRKYFDLVLCSLPFEPAWYHARGVPGAVFIGHPYFDELDERHLDHRFLADEERKGRPVVAILPGSRKQEISKNVPVLLRSAQKVAQVRPDVRFVVACLKEKHRHMVQEMIGESGIALANLEVHAGKTAELIRVADIAWAVSGSVSLELMAEALPTVVVYTIRPFDLWIARPFIKAKYICLVNLLADAELMPEYLASRDVSDEISSWGLKWLNDSHARAEASQALAKLRERVAEPGASDRAAARIAQLIESRRRQQTAYRGPHTRESRAAVSAGSDPAGSGHDCG
jgi:lipid-A-disaccharide synthase